MKYFINIFILSLLVMIAPFSIDAYIPSFDSIQIFYGVGISSLQSSVAIYTLFAAITMFFSGYVSDIVGRKKVVLLGLIGYSITAYLITKTSMFQYFLLLRAIQGFFGAMVSSLPRTIIRDLYTGVRAHKAMSLLSILFGFAPILAPLIGGWLEQHCSWEAVFLFMSCYALVLAIIFHLLIPETLAKKNRQPVNFKIALHNYYSCLTNTEFLVKTIVFTVFSGLGGMFVANVAYFAIYLNFKHSQVFLLFLPVILGSMLGAFCTGQLAGKIRARQYTIISIAVGWLILILCLLCIAFNLLGHYVTIVLPFTLLFFGLSFISPVIILDIFALLNKKQQGLASSFQGLFQLLSFSMYMGFVSPILQGNLSLIYLVAPIIYIISLSSLGLINRYYLLKHNQQSKRKR